jgi:hypothetical protein
LTAATNRHAALRAIASSVAALCKLACLAMTLANA